MPYKLDLEPGNGLKSVEFASTNFPVMPVPELFNEERTEGTEDMAFSSHT